LIVGHKERAEYYRPYLEAVRRAGGEPELDLPATEAIKNEESLKEFLRHFQGILLPGGADVHPQYYDEEVREETKPAESALDEGQFAVARYVVRESPPTLAICRGLQVLGVTAGARLYQNLPTDRPLSMNHNVNDSKVHLAHEVIIDNASHLARASESARFEVNSRHHQALKLEEAAAELGPFRIIARAPDGIVEGMEIPDHPFCIAVQWHPENLFLVANPHARGLFSTFVEACRT